MRDALPRRGQLGAGDDVDIEPSVAVVVEERDAVAAGLEDVVLRRAAAEGRSPAAAASSKVTGDATGDVAAGRPAGPGPAGPCQWRRRRRPDPDLRLAPAALEGEAERDFALEPDAGALPSSVRMGAGVDALVLEPRRASPATVSAVARKSRAQIGVEGLAAPGAVARRRGRASGLWRDPEARRRRASAGASAGAAGRSSAKAPRCSRANAGGGRRAAAGTAAAAGRLGARPALCRHGAPRWRCAERMGRM